MRSSSWLRFGLTSLIVGSAGLGAVLVACSDDDPTPGATATPDSGNDADVPPGPNDSGSDAPTPPKAQPAKLQVVNAATSLGPDDESGMLRICYAIEAGGQNVFPLPALPDTKTDPLPIPGIPIGTGGVAQTTGASLETLKIIPFVMNAETLAARGIVKGPNGNAGMGCGDLIGADKDAGGQGPLTENKDYWKLPALEAGQFMNEKSYVLVLTGCVGNAEVENAETCGTGFETGDPGVGTLKLTKYEIDRATTIDATKIGTQFIHASQAGALALAEAGGVTPGYTTADGGTFKGVSTGTVAVNTVTPLVQVEGVDVATDKFTANANIADLGIPLTIIKALSALPAGVEYKNGAAFTFIAVGDPAEPSAEPPAFNTKKFHYIALPNDPAAQIYK